MSVGRSRHAVFVAALGAISASNLRGQLARVDTLATGLGQPMSMVFISRDTALVSAHGGDISLLDVRTGRHTAIPGMPRPLVEGEAGTKVLALHPSYATNRLVYLSLVVGSRSRNALAVVRGRFTGAAFVDTTTILTTAPADTSVDHFGGRILFQGSHLFVSTGDRHNRPLVQDLGTHHGKILRINPDGTVPSDNPFVGRAGARPEVWSYGHRNVQGLAYDSTNGILWAHEHGPRQGDELNRIERGRDYGWPRVSFGWEYEGGPIGAGIPLDSITPAPAWVWPQTVAPSGLLVYSGRAFPAWRGNLLSGTMQAVRGLHLNRLVWNGSRFVLEERLFSGQLGRVRFVAEDSRGWVYLGNDNGQILRVRP